MIVIDQVHIKRLRRKAWNKCLKNLTRVIIRFEKNWSKREKKMNRPVRK